MPKFSGWLQQSEKNGDTGSFELLRYFTTASVIVFIVVTALLAAFFSQVARNNIINLGERKNVTLTYSFANSLWPEFAPFFASAGGLSADQLRNDFMIYQFYDSVLAQMSGLTVRKVKVYDLEGLTVFSTELSQIGQDKSANAGFLAARDGRVVSELAHRDTFSAFEGEIENRDLLLSYVPIRRGPTQPIEGVFEVYDDMTELLQEMQRNQVKIIAGIVVILGGLYMTLFFVVRHADKLIRRQHEKIQQVNAELAVAHDQALALNDKLEQRVGERTATLTLEIEERKKAEQALRESEEKYSSLVEHSNDGIVIIQDGIVKFANQRSIEITGLSPEEVLGKPFVSFICPEYRELVTDRYRRRMSGEAVPNRYEVEVFSKEGKIAVEISASPIIYEGKPADMALLHDITERKKAEEALLQKNKELEMFAYTAAHDLQAPLVTVQGFASMFKKDLEKNETGRLKEDVSLIETGISKMQRLLKSVLEYGRTNRIPRPTEEIPFREIIEESIQQVAEQIRSSEATISVTENFPNVTVDRVSMVQVLNNLIVNAIDYRDKTRQLTIEIGHRKSDGEVIYFVRDNGMGISPDQREKVFELFYRGASQSPGTGLGLTIVKRIVEGHGGRVWIESEAGKGTAVCFTLATGNGRKEKG